MSLLIKRDNLIRDAGDVNPLAGFENIWTRLNDDYEELVEDIMLYLNNECKARGIRVAISGRVKSIDSIKNSISRRSTQGERCQSLQDIFEGIHDLVGFRIVADYPSGIAKAQDIIEKEFELVKASELSHERDLGLGWKPVFGAFSSTNYRVKVDNVHSLHRFHGILVEIQVLSLAENLYNKLAHELIHKESAGDLSIQDQNMIRVSHGLSLCYWICLSSMEDKLEQNPKIPQAVRRVGGVADLPKLAQATPDLESPSGTIPVATLINFLRDNQANSANSDIELRGRLKEVAGRQAQAINHHSGSGHNINQFAPSTNNFGPSTSNYFSSDLKTSVEIRNHTATNERERINNQNNACMEALKALTVDSRDVALSIEGRKEPLFHGAFEWIFDTAQYQAFSKTDIDNPKPTRLLWIRGGPGSGKTMTILGIYRRMMAEFMDVSTNTISILSLFFAQAIGPKYNNATAILGGLVWLLARQQPHLVSHLSNECNGSGNSLFTDGNEFIALSRILKAMIEDATVQRVLLVVDALDECQKDLPELIKLLAEILQDCSKVQILISSRPLGSYVEYPLRRYDEGLQILDLDSISMEQAVNSYIDYRINDLAKREKNFSPDQQATIKQSLEDNAGATFLWVSLVCKLLEQRKPHTYSKIVKSTPTDLVKVYDKMFSRIGNDEYSDPDEYKSVFRVATVAIGAVTLVELAGLLQVPLGNLEDMIDECGPLLLVRGNRLYFMHQSVKEFVSERLWGGDISLGHSYIAEMALGNMRSNLSKDICNLKQYDAPPPDEESKEAKSLRSLRYACIYWIDHVLQSKIEASLLQLVEITLKAKFLNWIEFLSLLRQYPVGITTLQTLMDILKATDTTAVPNLSAFIVDAHWFLRYHRPTINSFPMQIYASALVFSPTKSVVRQTFQGEIPNVLVRLPTIIDDWDASVQTIMLEYFIPSGTRFLEGYIDKIVFSSHYKLLACIFNFRELASYDDEPEMAWYVALTNLNGVTQYTCKHHERILDVAFQPNGNIVSRTATMVFYWDNRGQLQNSYNLLSAPRVSTDDDLLPRRTVVVADTKVLCSGSVGNILSIWHLEGTEQKSESYDLRDLCRSQGPFNHVLLSDGRIVVWNLCDDLLHVWKGLKNREGLDKFTGNFDIRIFDQLGQCLESLQGHEAPIIDISYTREGFISSLSADGIVITWDSQGKPKHRTNCGEGAIGMSMITNKAVVTLHYRHIPFSKPKTYICLWTLGLHENYMRCYSLKNAEFSWYSAELVILSYPENSEWPFLGIRCPSKIMIVDPNLFTSAACEISYCIPALQAQQVMQIFQDGTADIFDVRSQNTKRFTSTVGDIPFDPEIPAQLSADGSRLCFVEKYDYQHCLHVFDTIDSQRLHIFSTKLEKSSFVERWDLTTSLQCQLMVSLSTIAFSANNGYLAWRSEESIVRADLNTGMTTSVIVGTKSKAQHYFLSLSATGQFAVHGAKDLLSAADQVAFHHGEVYSRHIEIWNLENATLVQRIDHPILFHHLEWSVNGEYVLLSGGPFMAFKYQLIDVRTLPTSSTASATTGTSSKGPCLVYDPEYLPDGLDPYAEKHRNTAFGSRLRGVLAGTSQQPQFWIDYDDSQWIKRNNERMIYIPDAYAMITMTRVGETDREMELVGLTRDGDFIRFTFSTMPPSN